MPVRLTLLLRIAVVLFLLPQGLSLAGSPGLILGGAFPHLVASSSTYKHIDPRLAEYFHGISLYRSGQWAEAASIFEDILDKNPEFSMAVGAAADAYWRLQQTDKAHSYYALAARLCEEKLQRRAQRGLTLDITAVTADLVYYRYRLGQLDAGWKILESLEPESREKLAGPASMLLFALGKFDKAREEFCRAMQKDPLDPRLLEFQSEAQQAGHQFTFPEKRPPQAAPRAYALIIGIGQYKDKGITQLSYPANDAICIDRALRNHRYSLFDSENVVVLLDRQATNSAIKRELLHLGTKATARDLVMIYYAGRTAWEGEDAYWITYDTELEQISATALSNLVIADLLTRLPALRTVVFVDSCYNMSYMRAASSRLKNLSDFVSGPDGREMVFITAYKEARLPGDLKDVQHGMFFSHLCEVFQGNGDKNKDGIIGIDESWFYIRNRFSPSAKQDQFFHAPAISGPYTKGFAIAKNPLKK